MSKFDEACRVVSDSLKELTKSKSELNIEIPKLKSQRDKFSQMLEEKKNELIKVNLELGESRKRISANSKTADKIIEEARQEAEVIINKAKDREKSVNEQIDSALKSVDEKIESLRIDKDNLKADLVSFNEAKETYLKDKSQLEEDIKTCENIKKNINDRSLELDKREMVISNKEKEAEDLLAKSGQYKEESDKSIEKSQLILNSLLVMSAKINKLSAQVKANEKTADSKLTLAYRKEKEIREREIRLEDREQTLKTHLTL